MLPCRGTGGATPINTTSFSGSSVLAWLAGKFALRCVLLGRLGGDDRIQARGPTANQLPFVFRSSRTSTSRESIAAVQKILPLPTIQPGELNRPGVSGDLRS